MGEPSLTERVRKPETLGCCADAPKAEQGWDQAVDLKRTRVRRPFILSAVILPYFMQEF